MQWPLPVIHQVFQDNLWHGDLHPGNLLVTPSGQLAVLDSGITCSLSNEDRANLIDTFRAVVLSDGARVGELFLERSKHACKDRQGFIGQMQVWLKPMTEDQKHKNTHFSGNCGKGTQAATLFGDH